MNLIETKALLHTIIVDLMFMSRCVAVSFERRFEHKSYGGHVMCDGDVMTPKIHWDLNWLNQWDQQLIKFIRDELLIPPPTYSKNNLNLVNKYDPNKPWKHQGQYGEALVVEYLYEKNMTQKGSENSSAASASCPAPSTFTLALACRRRKRARVVACRGCA